MNIGKDVDDNNKNNSPFLYLNDQNSWKKILHTIYKKT